ncbi:iron-siderophore ABC transporter substrate-binding protein [Microlunatus elymi]|uniref:Iron-siderophore ABC transporter substrate-binding protein n=1 Tax=Microlunatus elymi TaxID=2596828 RepID=A0A516PZX4_9ACTN|nr:iron-siderophore ABC transporter substrate-binding protein [Microlunatus elymi]QDP96697.1 iron-siderophore ABC transporter substrate-binding protein [Microlunatus elymi]
MSTFTRRTFALLTLAAGSAAVVGCSSGATAGGSADAAGTPAGTGYPMTFDHAFGRTELTAVPRRVVALGVNDGDALLALGSVPVGNTGYTFYADGFGPWAKPYLKGAELTLIESDSEPKLEQIASLRPDLISALNAGIDQAAYDKLAKIAPTLARPADVATYAVPSSQQLDLLGRALDKSSRAADLTAGQQKLIKETVASHPRLKGRTGVVILPYDGQYAAYLPRDPRGAFLAALGIQLPKKVADLDDGKSFFTPISAEQVPLLDGDLLVVIGAEDKSEFTKASSLFRRLKSKIVFADTDQRGAISYNSVLSIPYAITSLVPKIDKAIGS